MQKLKRLVALLGVFLLVMLYVITFVFAIIDNPNTFSLFKISFAATIAVPVILWILGIFIRLSKKEDDLSSPAYSPDDDPHQNGGQGKDDTK